jgi:hypothetical protein
MYRRSLLMRSPLSRFRTPADTSQCSRFFRVRRLPRVAPLNRSLSLLRAGYDLLPALFCRLLSFRSLKALLVMKGIQRCTQNSLCCPEIPLPKQTKKSFYCSWYLSISELIIPRTSPSSGLEAFSHNLTDDSFTSLAFQPKVLPNIWINGSSRTELVYY